MALSFFCDKFYLPSEQEVGTVLGNAADLWQQIKQHIEGYGTVKEEWKIYSQKAGWCKKILLLSGKDERNIVFLYPNTDCITCVMVYGDKAVEEAVNSEIPKETLDSILEAKPYKEGRSFQVVVKDSKELELFKKVIDIKVKN